MARRTYKEQKNDYKGYSFTIPSDMHGNEEMHLLERVLLSWYKVITKNGTEDVKFMSRRAAQALGWWKWGTKQPQTEQVEKITKVMIDKGWLYMYKQGDELWLKFTYKAKPVVKASGPVGASLF